MKSELEKLYSQIDDIEIAMLTTRPADGQLRSRAMATQKRADGAHLWFVTLEETPKLRDLAADPHLNLSYYQRSLARVDLRLASRQRTAAADSTPAYPSSADRAGGSFSGDMGDRSGRTGWSIGPERQRRWC
jgi:Pyridoxamine 5'-phosphate oxidase like